MITKLGARAFKGLREFNIAPQRVNVLLGANGTGKSNFADLIAFMSKIPVRGLVSAMDDFGGLPQVRTRQPGVGTPYKLQLDLNLSEDRSRGIQSVHFQFALAQSRDVKVQMERLEAVLYKRKAGKPAKQGVPRFDFDQPIEIGYRRDGNKVSNWTESLGQPIAAYDEDNELLLASYGKLGELRTLTDYLNSWRVYNIDAAMAKQSTGGSDIELDRYGANIVPFVARMLQKDPIREQLIEDLCQAVPYITGVKPDRVLTYQTLRFTEQDSGAEFQLPEMSDGTIRLLGLLAVLRQPVPPAVLVIEEPENALHAYAIRHFLEVARRVAMSHQFASQLFFTSHSPMVVDELLSVEAQRDTNEQTACFVTQRRPNALAIVPAPDSVMHAIAQNLGRPSDFQREGDFGDEPTQLELPVAAGGQA